MRVLITGIQGQDGFILANYLLKNTNNDIYGVSLPVKKNNNVFKNKNLKIFYGDITDEKFITKLVKEIKPDYFVNFAALSDPFSSWNEPNNVLKTNFFGVLNCLEALRKNKPECRFYNAGTSQELEEISSPYGLSKILVHRVVNFYKKQYNMFSIQSILFNHESPKRGIQFVTKKISTNVVKIYDSLKKNEEFKPLELGNIHTKRDWGDAEEYVKGIWLMLQQEKPKEYTLATGKQHSVKEFVEEAFQCVGINGEWKENEEDPLKTTYEYEGKTLVKINPKYYHPIEVKQIVPDLTLTKKDLGWSSKTTFKELVKKMVDFELSLP